MAYQIIKHHNNKEIEYAEDALNWAARTYLVAALAAITYLLYYLSILKLLFFLNKKKP